MRSLLGVLLFAASAGAVAQEGFPLDGTWRGERQASGENPATIVMVMQWDGKQVTGVINPGPKAIPIADAKLIPEGWRVTVAARDANGQPISFEGTISNLGKYSRSIAGKWTEGGRSYNVRMVRE
jgi:hypothetical protein